MNMTSQPEFSRIIKLSELGSAPVSGEIIADKTEKAALAQRFDLPEIISLKANYTLDARKDRIICSGLIKSKLFQICAISDQEFPVQIKEEFQIAFHEKPVAEDKSEEEIELNSEDCDVMEYEAQQVDIGEAVSQTLYLALDPYPRGPDADEIARKKGFKSEEEAGPFGALSALKDKLG